MMHGCWQGKTRYCAMVQGRQRRRRPPHRPRLTGPEHQDRGVPRLPRGVASPLARSFHADAPAHVLDEPTATLDARAERRIPDQFITLASRRAALIITHRLANACCADRIVVTDTSRIVETGTYRELLQWPGGLFAELHRLQEHSAPISAETSASISSCSILSATLRTSSGPLAERSDSRTRSRSGCDKDIGHLHRTNRPFTRKIRTASRRTGRERKPHRMHAWTGPSSPKRWTCCRTRRAAGSARPGGPPPA
jgi:ATPase subunit of ABC transporter with duplicated ATPase domains